MTTSFLVCLLLTFSCAWVWLSAGAGIRRIVPDADESRLPSRLPVLAIGVGLAAVAWWLLRGGGVQVLVLSGGVLVAASVIARLASGARLRRMRRRRQLVVIEFCDALAAEMQAGAAAGVAVERSSRSWPELAPVASAARLGGDVAQALRERAAVPGLDGLRAIAAAWEVAVHSGAVLAGVLDRVAAGLRADDEARAEVTAALGPPRATAKMLAVLPVFGLALGASMGARPLQFLLHTNVGVGC
nr:type II secretion system F family protein [Nocardioidaceae bacterium]